MCCTTVVRKQGKAAKSNRRFKIQDSRYFIQTLYKVK